MTVKRLSVMVCFLGAVAVGGCSKAPQANAVENTGYNASGALENGGDVRSIDDANDVNDATAVNLEVDNAANDAHSHRIRHVEAAPISAATPGPTASIGGAPSYCALIDEVATQADCDLYKARQNALASGVAAFNPPSRMKQGDTVMVELAVANAVTASAPGGSPTEQIGGPAAAKQSAPVKVGRHMAATLKGDGFTIAALNPDEQDLFTAGTAHWAWNVTAQAAASHQLILTTLVEVPDDKGVMKSEWVRSKTFDVNVAVTPTERVESLTSNFTAWITSVTGVITSLTALAAAAFGLWVAVGKFRKSSGK